MLTRVRRLWLAGQSLTLGILVILMGGCVPDDPTGPGDEISPQAVIDLVAVPDRADPRSVTLVWHAVGDDGGVGQAMQYDLRRAPRRLVADAWDAAERVPGIKSPGPAGEREQAAVVGLTPGVTHYFALRVGDDAGNWSPLSNSAAYTVVELAGQTSSRPAPHSRQERPRP